MLQKHQRLYAQNIFLKVSQDTLDLFLKEASSQFGIRLSSVSDSQFIGTSLVYVAFCTHDILTEQRIQKLQFRNPSPSMKEEIFGNLKILV